jgi:predicted AAA+ superfamily ATPase
MVRQLVGEAISRGIDPRKILYVSVDTPVYAGFPLEKYIRFFDELNSEEIYLVIFDEIQYLKDWATHLKDLVDSYGNIKFVATGSAAAALKLKSNESGAGRFTDFMLPPLTFFEFLSFKHGSEDYVEQTSEDEFLVEDIHSLNREFLEYLNYGGYPEAVMNEQIRQNPEQFIKNDIIDKVLLKDLPSLYGINDIQELNRLFSFLAYNTGSEASLEKISRESGLAKPTIKKYIEYLESAFLIIKVPTVDENCKTLMRERNFKIYLSNPSMWSALFRRVDEGDTTNIGHLTESAIFSQWQHSPASSQLRYARWKNEGELDIVYLNPGTQKPEWVGEVKWSDRIRIKALRHFLRKNTGVKSAIYTTRTVQGSLEVEGIKVVVRPSSLHSYILGKNITTDLWSATDAIVGGAREGVEVEDE